MPKRQALTQSRLIDLDHLRPGRLEIVDLVADGERDLPACQASGDIVADKGPVEDRHRSGQHALDRLVGKRLGIFPPADRHRFRTRHITEDDGRTHVTRAVALHPRMLGEGETGKLFTEILHHVIALELTMHENIEANFLLPADRRFGFFLQEAFILRIGQSAFRMR
ncbi:hypothetical protein D3C86_1689940 [compost metagenome]